MFILALGLAGCAEPETAAQRFAAMEHRAAGGDARACYILGLMHEQGFGVAPDKSQAASCYRKAADKGLVEAQYRLGSLYYHGQGVPKDLEQAAAWYKKAAEQGNPQAQAELGSLYVHGVPRDSARAANGQKKSLPIKEQSDCRHND
jgi:uncharacterized protein